MATLSTLPSELVLLITSFANLDGAYHLLCTCKKMNEILGGELWKLDAARQQSRALRWAIDNSCLVTLQKAWDLGSSFGLDLEGQGILSYAARRGSEEIIDAICHFSGDDPRRPHMDFFEALELAVEWQSSSCVSMMINFSPSDNLPIQRLYAKAVSCGNSSTAGFLLGLGADPNGRFLLDASVLNGNADGVRMVLQHGADLPDLDICLELAVSEDEAGVFRALVEQSQELRGNYAGVSQWFDRCIQLDACKVAEVLLTNGACLDIFLDSRYFRDMVLRGSVKMLELLVRVGAGPTEDYTFDMALLDASLLGKTGLVRFFLECGANINTDCEPDSSPLHCAAQFGQLGTIQFLLQRGANPNIVNRYGETPMHAAAMSWDGRAIEALKRGGTLINASNELGITALHLAAVESDTKVINELMRHGANPFKRDGYGENPLHYAAWFGNVEAASALLRATNNSGIDLRDNRARTALFHASWKGRVALCRLLVSRGACPLITDFKQATIFHAALRNGNRRCLTDLWPVFNERLKDLLQSAVDCSQRDLEDLSQLLHDSNLAVWMRSRSINRGARGTESA
ncbi:hypothetical protein G3M48_007274 [Beauveria asiatica]|uniref:Ankyrin repeat protein n=1 Tax=Beauveria asiatica TaxID=1069075 RepID=A0AAW0RMF1_9HYPO